MNIPDIKNLKQGQFSKCSIQKQYPEFYNFLIKKYENIHVKKFSEYLYLYFHNMNEPPKCPICGKQLKLQTYSNGYGKYCSVKCEHLSEEYKENIKQTCLKRYGVKKYNNTEKIKQTCMKKYGVDNPSKVKQFKEKRAQTMIDRYGVKNYFQSEECKEKSKQTCMKKYGTEYASQTKEFQEKVRQTCRKRYGVDRYTQTEEYKEKTIQTSLDKYGVENIAKLEETTKKKKLTCLKKYGVESNTQTEEFKEKYEQTMLKNYGAKHYFQSEEYRSKIQEIQNKIYKTKQKRHTFNSSKIEQQFKQWLDDNHINYIYQYKNSEKYPFNCDFYFPDKDLYLEIQGYFTHNDHPYNPNNDNDVKELEKLKMYNYHDVIKTWTVRDPLKRETARKNNLNWMEVFTSDVDVLIDKVKDFL